jgi:hypothetical protein
MRVGDGRPRRSDGEYRQHNTDSNKRLHSSSHTIVKSFLPTTL